MMERTGLVTFGGNPMTLVGPELKVGDDAPNVEVVDNDLQPVRLSTYKGKVAIVTSVASLETSTCDVETRRFNLEAGKLGDDVAVLTVSMDLPFTQKRWCGSAGVEMVKTYSDHRSAAFGEAWGVLMKEIRLLARAVFVVDREGDIRYIEVLSEVGDEPDYEAALNAAKGLL
ncbi:MAG: thiol peroxidase [Candidatus Eisenbacteria bacterium]